MSDFSYRWNLKDTIFTKDKGKVFSCFACGGGSTMGYKLAGFDVIGANEIDPKMAEAYKVNHNPKYLFVEPIQTFKLREDLPQELFELDILDGSPPCSSFSMAGNRESDWGKDKVFREGQSQQILDTLFFDFIDLAKKLQPKIVIAENVLGLLFGEAKQYVIKIYKEFEKAGYYLQHFVFDSSKMGVPQKRERVFFIALRKDLSKEFLYQADLFSQLPYIEIKFNELEIKFNELEINNSIYPTKPLSIDQNKWFELTQPGESFSINHPKGHWFGHYKVHPDKVLPTITAGTNASAGFYHYKEKRLIYIEELILASSFPQDYNFTKFNKKPCYLLGMSVPPLMTARIAKEIYKQWLSKINC